MDVIEHNDNYFRRLLVMSILRSFLNLFIIRQLRIHTCIKYEWMVLVLVVKACHLLDLFRYNQLFYKSFKYFTVPTHFLIRVVWIKVFIFVKNDIPVPIKIETSSISIYEYILIAININS